MGRHAEYPKRPGGNQRANSDHNIEQNSSARVMRAAVERELLDLAACAMRDANGALARAAMRAFKSLRDSWSPQEVLSAERALGLRQ